MESRIKTYLSFLLDDEIFAVNVEKVLEVLEFPKITKVPKAPAYIEGVVNFRGEILPVVDTRIKFNMPETKETSETVIIVLDLVFKEKSVILGAMVDAVKDVIEINITEIKSVPEMGSRYNVDFLSGMYRIDERFIMILDIDKVFSIEEMSVKSQAESELEII